jgi:predicted dehydrogenase
VDYLSQPFRFKVRKALRYTLLYGPSRTYVKVLGQRHMRRKFDRWPARGSVAPGQLVGIIGCGNYAYTTIAYYLTKHAGRVIGACMDRNLERAASLVLRYRVPVYTTDVEELLAAEPVRLVYVASNHASHAEYAIQALRRGKSVYIEKPHVVSEEQLVRLLQAMDACPGRVFLGFNRPGSRFGRIIRAHLDREPGPGMYNWFVAGHAIEPNHWYFKPEEGGRVLGNLCHWTDFILQLVPTEAAYPIRITPTAARLRDADIAVTYTFADDTIAVISFSAKGHTFEGVRERFSAHKGSCLVSMDDYRRLTIDVLDVKRRWWNWYRDHGHRDNIVRAYENVVRDEPYDRVARRRYVANTAWLFLKTREALESGKELAVHPFDDRP